MSKKKNKYNLLENKYDILENKYDILENKYNKGIPYFFSIISNSMIIYF